MNKCSNQIQQLDDMELRTTRLNLKYENHKQTIDAEIKT